MMNMVMSVPSVAHRNRFAFMCFFELNDRDWCCAGREGRERKRGDGCYQDWHYLVHSTVSVACARI